MKYFALIALFSFIPAALGVADDAEFFKRAGCGDNNACGCPSGKEGLFCGDGIAGCIKGHVYQCGEKGSISCDFGIRDSCVKCNKLNC